MRSQTSGALRKRISDGEMQLCLGNSNCQSGLVPGDENDENGVNELMEHRLRSDAITLRFTFSFVSFMVLMSSRASLDLSCDFIIRLLHNTQSSKSKIFLQQRQR